MALIGDRERERTARVLREHFERGRLSVEELAERLELALRARRKSDVRHALSGLPAVWRDQAAEARSGLDSVKQAAGRIALLVLVWSLWWAVTLVLLIGFVTTVVMNGASLTNAALFAALWIGCTLLARHVARQHRPAGR